ncbi:hypothetical protein C9J03_25905 [Photobacterium gaetbulicola]|uniref:Putative resolvase domain-containing protein n=1 Tax=Photobacterium gaetbulicola Gung47 TaxID=658445 RepID=A0A0C5WT92_9GAMM|nr:recombinase family protein [Photobacterium gaetbulicola]AJR09627.1 putative resolvase domain-containing protein [Photobacterium gaetbulicola Gung47]PST99180.1 hypothetical protein C9J03_25905 [Photobacterium gaetbulicola]
MNTKYIQLLNTIGQLRVDLKDSGLGLKVRREQLQKELTKLTQYPEFNAVKQTDHEYQAAMTTKAWDKVYTASGGLLTTIGIFTDGLKFDTPTSTLIVFSAEGVEQQDVVAKRKRQPRGLLATVEAANKGELDLPVRSEVECSVKPEPKAAEVIDQEEQVVTVQSKDDVQPSNKLEHTASQEPVKAEEKLDRVELGQAKVIAYVRVSDVSRQDSSTQRHTIEEYAKTKGFHITEWREFSLSGSKTTKSQRGIDNLVESVQSGDKVLVSDIARLGRESALGTLGTISQVIEQGAEFHFCYTKTIIKPENQNDPAVIFMALGEAWAAVKFAEERSHKAKAAAARRKTSGLHNGRKKGAVIKSKLDEYAAFITSELDNGTAKTKIIAKLADMGCKVGRTQFYAWVDKRTGGKGIDKSLGRQGVSKKDAN